MSESRVLSAHPIHSSWTLPLPYWIVVTGDELHSNAWMKAASSAGLSPLSGGSPLFGLQTSTDWAPAWQHVLSALETLPNPEAMKAAIIASESTPTADALRYELRPIADVQHIARNLWLLDDLRDDRLVCFMQRVVNAQGGEAGFEAFARIQSADGSIIGGGDIMRAAYALKVEYHVDRRLHKKAIEAFAESGRDGFIFINFLTGFIQRPEIYLEGLSQAVAMHAVPPCSVVLDVPLADYVRDMPKLRSIANYCRARGFSIALDDVKSTRDLEALLHEVRPTFVKLDGQLARNLTSAETRATALYDIVNIAHAAGAMVLGEGIENATIFEKYVAAGVDLLQGYHIGAPELMTRE